VATVQDVIDGVKWQADLQQGNRLTNADLIPIIDSMYKLAWEAIVEQYDDYFVKKISPDVAITGGVGLNTYTIVATDFFKLKAVQPLIGLTFAQPLEAHGMNEMGAVPDWSYRLVDSTIYFEPELSCAGTYRIWYIYTPPDLTAVGNTFVDINGMVKRFLIDAVTARVNLREEDTDTAVIQGLTTEMLARIRRVTANRNAGRGKRVARTRTSRRRALARTKTGYYLP